MANNNNKPRWHSFDVETDPAFFSTLIARGKKWAEAVPVVALPDVKLVVEVKPPMPAPADAPAWRLTVTFPDKARVEMVSKLLGAMGIEAPVEAVASGGSS